MLFCNTLGFAQENPPAWLGFFIENKGFIILALISRDFNEDIKLKDLEELSHEDILKSWEQEKNINLYIHTPFCKKICNFCVYSGIKDTDKQAVEKFYNRYLKGQLNFYDKILNSKNILNLWFGGGTPNLIGWERLNQIFNEFSFLHKAEAKTIEVHPSYLEKDFINSIIDNKFTRVIFGVQTFNYRTLHKNNRSSINLKKLGEAINSLKDNNISTYIDLLITDSDTDINSSLISTLKDLGIAINLNPDEITVAIDYNMKPGLSDKYKISFFNKIQNFFNTTEYTPNFFNINQKEQIVDFINTTKVFRFFKKGYNKYNSTILEENNYNIYRLNYDIEKSSTIGIGDYKSLYHPYSKNKMISYIEVNDKSIPKYYKTTYNDHSSLLEFFFTNTKNILGISKTILLDKTIITFDANIFYLEAKNNTVLYNILVVKIQDDELYKSINKIFENMDEIKIQKKFVFKGKL